MAAAAPVTAATATVPRTAAAAVTIPKAQDKRPVCWMCHTPTLIQI